MSLGNPLGNSLGNPLGLATDGSGEYISLLKEPVIYDFIDGVSGTFQIPIKAKFYRVTAVGSGGSIDTSPNGFGGGGGGGLSRSAILKVKGSSVVTYSASTPIVPQSGIGGQIASPSTATFDGISLRATSGVCGGQSGGGFGGVGSGGVDNWAGGTGLGGGGGAAGTTGNGGDGGSNGGGTGAVYIGDGGGGGAGNNNSGGGGGGGVRGPGGDYAASAYGQRWNAPWGTPGASGYGGRGGNWGGGAGGSTVQRSYGGFGGVRIEVWF